MVPSRIPRAIIDDRYIYNLTSIIHKGGGTIYNGSSIMKGNGGLMSHCTTVIYKIDGSIVVANYQQATYDNCRVLLIKMTFLPRSATIPIKSLKINDKVMEGCLIGGASLTNGDQTKHRTMLRCSWKGSS